MNRSKILEESFEVQNSLMQIWKQHFSEIIRQEGVTYPQTAVLMTIQELQPVMSKDVAKKLGLTPSAITQAIDGLPNAGLIIRDPDAADRRVVRLRLSKEGEQLIDRLKDKRKELFFKSTESLTDEELQAELTFQRKALEHLRAYIANKQA